MSSHERKPYDGPTMDDLLEKLHVRRKAALKMGGKKNIERHRQSGRQTVRERIDQLLDKGSFFETAGFALPERRIEKHVPGDAVITGFGTIGGREVGIIGIDATVMAGSTAPISMRKQNRVIEQSQRFGIPMILLCDSDGGRMPDVMGWRFSGLPLNFKTFLAAPEGMPVVPRVGAVLGPSYGDSALHASTAHFVVMTKNSAVALSGPTVIEGAIGEKITDQELGGPDKALKVGNAHMVVATEADAWKAIANFLSYMPDNSSQLPKVIDSCPPAIDPKKLEKIVPINPNRAYDISGVLACIADSGSIFPWANEWGIAVVTAFARIEGRPVGILASRPMGGAGALDPDSLNKMRKFADMCDTFNLALIFLHDVPGLLIGTEAEEKGIVQAYEQLVLRLARSKVPKIGVVMRKAYGGGHFAFAGRPTHPDFQFAWPSAQMGFMAPETGIRTVYRRELDKIRSEQGEEACQAKIDEYLEAWSKESEPWEAAANLSFDDVIEPAATRQVLADCLRFSAGMIKSKILGYKV